VVDRGDDRLDAAHARRSRSTSSAAARGTATRVEDGANADRHASDHVLREAPLEATTPLRARLAPGGGFVARLRPRAAR
jgi:hypothetical protein